VEKKKVNILRINFLELYQRHLCRHGQFGINVWHIIAVYGVYFSLVSLAAIVVRAILPQATVAIQYFVLTILFVPYLAVLLRNIPVAVFSLTALSALLLIVAAVATPGIPFWLHLILIPAWHRVQLISHRRYTVHHDMSAFDQTYKKGRTLFLLLAVYELPILLQYLAFGRKDWVK
jgi:hypothetical protein